MILKSKRNAFSLLTALFVIVLMATVAMLVMNMTGKMVKETTTQYQREQAALLAKSYTEYAIMAVTANDRTTNCLSDIDGTVGSNPANGNGYRIRARIAYIGHNAEVGTCSTVFSNSVNEANSPLNIIVDVYVEYKEADNTSAPWVTYHKRTLQKI
ncbi:hypothetical protein [Sulfurovum sp. AR]|uniref:type IV pilus modification PilV family protein n=1 Tax=Sulfurovum sp. AR TaxID=1165841 RepID=UPI00025C4B31|nr:hypothetical protein [Sulfurovum sp. AR]EIF50968.1 hypothetical protein SULAR_06353 [Sulfurovum sp. AR]